MNQQIVAISIDKVQTFLVEVIHAHVQEKQTEASTLKSIVNASHEISNDFFQAIEVVFSQVEIKELLSCSGVYIFSCALPNEAIEDRLNKLFLQYYRSSQGQKLLRYVFFEAEDDNEIKAIQEAKKRLKQSVYFNAIIEKNKDVLFSFSKEEKVCFLEEKSKKEDYPMFAKNIDALFRAEEADNEHRFRIVVIKADLDGMGDMFKNIGNYEHYRAISKILNDSVSLDGLHEAAENCRPDDRHGWLFPFYIAGDDIFFAVSVTNLIKGIDVCREILKSINEKLIEVNPQRKLSMSIGLDVTFNRQPIRYYFDMVEKQLKNAKRSNPPESLKEFLQSKISICGLTYSDVDYAKIKKHKKELKCEKNPKKSNNPGCRCNHCEEKRKINCALSSVSIWIFFLNDLGILHHIRHGDGCGHQLLGSPGFFYTLLERLTTETVRADNVKYINSVLYHLLPVYLDSPNKELREWELRLNCGIMQQLYQKGGERGKAIDLQVETKHRLETYLRLMLLFSDNRFNIAGVSGAKETPLADEKFRENVRKDLLTKPRDYLYQNLQSIGGRLLRGIFANIPEYDKEAKYKGQCLQRLHIDKSMFFKLRHTDKISIEKAAAMVELQNSSTHEEVNQFNESRLSEGKAPYHLYFDKSEFCRLTKKNEKWTPDFVDSLMLLYAYNEKTIQFKTVYAKQPEGGNQNAKHS